MQPKLPDTECQSLFNEHSRERVEADVTRLNHQVLVVATNVSTPHYPLPTANGATSDPALMAEIHVHDLLA